MSTVVFSYARMNPPTKGHKILIDRVVQITEQAQADHQIVISHSHDGIRNPLSLEKKLYYLKEFFPNMNFVAASPECPTIMDHLRRLNATYQNLYVVCGYDRRKEYEQLITKYNGNEYNFKYVEVVECGNLNTREFYSGTLARNLARGREIGYLIETYRSLYDKDELTDILKDIITQTNAKGEYLKPDLSNFAKVTPDHPKKFNMLLDLIDAINTFEQQEKVKNARKKQASSGQSSTTKSLSEA